MFLFLTRVLQVQATPESFEVIEGRYTRIY